MKRALLTLLVLAPAHALAQPLPTQDAPLTLDPAATGNQAPRRTTAPAPEPAAQKPTVVVVGPDGKVTTPAQDAPAENGYFVSNAQPAGQEPAEVHAGPTPELHVVRSGDTLWDICFYYFNDPWQWPKVWSYNPQITNPHWIYPGDLVRLLPRGMFAQATPEPDKTPDATKPADPLPAPARHIEVGLKKTAFVEKAELDTSIAIDGGVDEKVMLGDGDQVYLSYPQGKPPKVGERYSVYVPGRTVKHDGKDYGAYVNVIGTVEVVSVKQDKRARGVIVGANQEIERGARVGPLVKTFRNVPAVTPKVDLQVPIIALLGHEALIGQGEIVFIAAGKSSGVEVGNRMFIVRRGDGLPEKMSTEVGSDDRRFPARALGEVVVVEVGDKVSIALVTLSVQETGVGDLVMMQKPK